MTAETHNALRVHVCALIRELGGCLDSIGLAAEAKRLPGDDSAADAFIATQHLGEAAAAADTVCTHAADLLREIETALAASEKAAAPFLAAKGEWAS